MTGQATQPGWYRDPWQVFTWRWWNGTAWTADGHDPFPARLPAWLSIPVLIGALVVGVVTGPAISQHPAALLLAGCTLAATFTALRWLQPLRPEPAGARVHALLWGATVAAGGAIVINTMVHARFGETVTYVVSAPVGEEALKALALLIAARRGYLRRPIDGAVLAAYSALGFAAVENVMYFAEASGDGYLGLMFIGRGLLTPFAHPLFSLWTGLAVGYARNRRRRGGYVMGGYLLAVLLHAGWNATLVSTLRSDNPALLLPVGAGFIMLFVVVVGRLVALRATQQRRVVERIDDLAARHRLSRTEYLTFRDLQVTAATRRSLPWGRRRHFDAVHAALVALSEPAAGNNGTDAEHLAAGLARARCGYAPLPTKRTTGPVMASDPAPRHTISNNSTEPGSEGHGCPDGRWRSGLASECWCCGEHGRP